MYIYPFSAISAVSLEKRGKGEEENISLDSVYAY